ncbi:MAG: HEAT repeat domain-containing protein [Planctomycetota bacterium]
MARSIAALLLFAAPLFAHGGQFRPPGGQPKVPPPPGLPAQPTAPSQTGKVNHSWTVWWGYEQYQFVDIRRRQRERRGPTSGGEPEKKVDDWRRDLRLQLIPMLRAALTDKDKEVRTAAAVALGKLQAKEAIEDLQTMLRQDKLQEAREAALTGLMYMQEPQLRETFEKIARKRSEKLRVRGFALFGIGRLGDAESLRYLQAFFDRKDKRAKAILPTGKGERRQFRVAALAALLMSEAKGLDDFFAGVATDKRLDEQVRAYAASALGKVGARDKMGALVKLLKDEGDHIQVRRSAAVALGVLGKPMDAIAVQTLRGTARGGRDDPLRHFSLVSLGRIGGKSTVDFLLGELKVVRNEDREFVLIALGLSGDRRVAPTLVRALQTERNAKRKSAAAISIGLLGDPTIAAELHKEFRHAKDWLLMQSCSLALGMLDYKPSGERLKDVLTTKKQPALQSSAALAYAMIRQHSAVPLFVDMLRRTKSVVTMTAIVRVMSYLSSANAAKPLIDVWHDKKMQRLVRAYALVSLGQLADDEDFPLLVRMGFNLNYFVRCEPLDEAITIL